MSAHISVIVPTRNAAATLERCLNSIREQSFTDLEIVVVDNGSSDATVAIANRVADVVLHRGPERSAQRNHGWRAAHGEIVVFIDADMTLEPDVLAQSAAALAGDRQLGALIIPEVAFGIGFLARCRALEKRLYLGEGAVEAARVFRRSVLDATGGFDERLTAFEDWDLSDRVHATEYQIGRVSARVWHDEGRISLRRAYSKKRYYGRWLGDYRHRSEAPPTRPMARWVLFRRWRELSRQPGLALGLAVLKLAEATGFAVGAVTAHSKVAAVGRR